MINRLRVDNNWQALAREYHLDGLAWQQRILTANIVGPSDKSGSAASKVKMWSDRSAASLSRVEEMLEFLKAEIDPDYAVFSMVLRESQALAQQTEVKN